MSPGIPRRTVPLRPDKSHFYARVCTVIPTLNRNMKLSGISKVELLYVDNAGMLQSVYTHAPAVLNQGPRRLQVGDSVLFKQYECRGRATEDGNLDINPIMVVYSKEEEEELTSRGVFFPECPPENLPGGYYG